MASSAIIGHGATLSIGGSDVAALTSITGPAMARDVISLGNHDDTGYVPYASGLADPGEVTIEGMFDSTAGQDALVAHFELATTPTFIITYSDGTTMTFAGFVTAFSNTAPFDGALTFSATIKVTGEPVLVAAEA